VFTVKKKIQDSFYRITSPIADEAAELSYSAAANSLKPALKIKSYDCGGPRDVE